MSWTVSARAGRAHRARAPRHVSGTSTQRRDSTGARRSDSIHGVAGDCHNRGKESHPRRPRPHGRKPRRIVIPRSERAASWVAWYSIIDRVRGSAHLANATSSTARARVPIDFSVRRAQSQLEGLGILGGLLPQPISAGSARPGLSRSSALAGREHRLANAVRPGGYFRCEWRRRSALALPNRPVPWGVSVPG